MKNVWCALCIAALATLVVAAQGPGPAGQDKAAVRYSTSRQHRLGAHDHAERPMTYLHVVRQNDRWRVVNVLLR